MQKLAFKIIVVLSFLTCTSRAQAPSTNVPASSINERAIRIYSKTGSWTLDELNKLALKKLIDSKQMPPNLHLETIIKIFVEGKTPMCDIRYLQGFEKPCWHVKIGFDGKVLSMERKIMKEG